MNENFKKVINDLINKNKLIDASKIIRELNWYPRTTFEQGIKKTIDWYYENKEWMEKITDEEYKNYCKTIYEN